MRHIDVSKIIFWTLVAVFLFALGMYSAMSKNLVYKAVKHIEDSFKIVWQERKVLTKSIPEYLLQPSRYPGSGVTINKLDKSGDELVLLAGFFGNDSQIRLIKRNGEIVNSWTARFSEHFSDTSHLRTPPATDWNVDTHGVLVLPDGSVVFNYEFSGLVKLDRCGNIVWKLHEMTHHSVEHALGGGFWVPNRHYRDADEKSAFPPFTTPFYEDTILKVSDTGEILKEISVPQVFFENGLEALLTATGRYFGTSDNEVVHLNKVAELTPELASDFPMFSPGDLLLSLRTYNMLLVVAPDSLKVKWWQIGPWIRQHDPEFKKEGKIVLFNNNTYPVYSDKFAENLSEEFSSTPKTHSNIMELDVGSGQTSVVFGRNDDDLRSGYRGKLELLPYGNILITDFEGGRAVEVDQQENLVWQYVNRHDENNVAELTEVRVYPSTYFSIMDWECPAS